MESHENMDKQLKRSLDDFSVQPRISSFDEILLKLERKKRRRIFWFLFPGLLFLAGGTALFYLLPGNTRKIYTSHLPNRVVDARPVNTAPGDQYPDRASLSGNPARTVAKSPSGKPQASNAARAQTKKEAGDNGRPVSEQGEAAQTIAPAFSEEEPQGTSTAGTLAEQADLPADGQASVVVADQLEPVAMQLPYTPASVEANIEFKERSPEPVITPEKKNTLRFFRGVSFEPQLNTYVFSDNKRSYADESFRSLYLRNRRDQNTIDFNYALGIKGGVVLNEKWEFQSGLGFQQFKYSEKVYPIISPGRTANNFSPTSHSLQSYDPKKGFVYNAGSAVEYDKAYVSRLNYIWHISEAARYFTFSNMIKIKAGIGLRLGYLFGGTIINAIGMNMYDDYIYTKPFTASPLLATLNLKLGYMEDIGKRLQLQICPNAFYTPNSMFRRYYPVKQRALGAGLELIILYKLN